MILLFLVLVCEKDDEYVKEVCNAAEKDISIELLFIFLEMELVLVVDNISG